MQCLGTKESIPHPCRGAILLKVTPDLWFSAQSPSNATCLLLRCIVGITSVLFGCSVVSDSVTPWTAASQASLVHHRLPEFTQTQSIELVMPSNHLILCLPLLLPPSVFPSIRIFSNESVFRIRWPKYWSFSFSINPSNEYSGLISFSMDCLDLLVLPGIIKSLLWHHSSKASILWCSAFFIAQFSHPYMTTGKSIALTRRTLLAK